MQIEKKKKQQHGDPLHFREMFLQRSSQLGIHKQPYQANLTGKLETMKDVVWSGDGSFDSMGHSVKHGAYTMLWTTVMKVVHFEILQ